MKILLILTLLLMSNITSAHDLISKANHFLWKLDTAQIQTTKVFVFGSDQVVKDQMLMQHLTENVLSFIPQFLHAAVYKDETDTYGVVVDSSGANQCVVNITSNKDYTDTVNVPVNVTYCENLLGFQYMHYMTTNVKFILMRTVVEAMLYVSAQSQKKSL
jgi:hypothetical protein